MANNITYAAGGMQLADQYGFVQECTAQGEGRIVEPYRLVGTTFEGSTIDTNFWTATQTGTGAGSAQTGGFLTTQSGTTTTGVGSIKSVRSGRYIAACSNRFRSQTILPDTGNANNIRRWGVGDGTSQASNLNNGAFFELNGTTLRGVTRTNATGSAVDTVITFSGFTLDTNMHTYEIYYTNKKVYFSIDDTLVGTRTVTTTNWSATKNFFAICESINSAGTTTYSISHASMTIVRFGKPKTEVIYKYISTSGTYNLKLSQGKIQRIIHSGAGANLIDVYDSPTTNANQIAQLKGQNNIPDSIDFGAEGCPFFNGLTVITGGNFGVTIIYE